MVPLGGVVGSAAGSQLSQTTGSDNERAQKESVGQERQLNTTQRAEQSAGIGQTERDQETTERDADGRRLWEAPLEPGKDDADQPDGHPAAKQSKDTTGQCGGQLDLTG
jgi:hypothetical protein